MACFPRFPRIFHRTKSTFTLGEDGNTDTILNNADNSVEIGKYIRREETPIFTPKSSQGILHKSPSQNSNSPHLNANHINTHHNNNHTEKKFSSNKNKTNSSTAASTKLKPVKERRPTALPTDIKKFDESDDDDYGVDGENNDGVVDYDYDEDDDDDDSGKKQHEEIEKERNGLKSKGFDTTDDGTCIELTSGEQNNTSTPTATTTPTTQTINGVKFFIGQKTKQDSGLAIDLHNDNATKLDKKKNLKNVTDNKRGIGSTKKSKEAELKINIPPPPPLPAKPLTTVSSSTSLISIKSGKSKTSIKSKQLHDDNSNNSNNDDDCITQKSHRAQGGLIFTRQNLPAQQQVEIEFIKKDETIRNLIRTAIENNEFLNNYMDKERKEMVIDAMAPDRYEKGSFIIRENDEGSEIYVSEEGTFDVIKNGEVIQTFGPATIFGELAILYNAKRLASIKASTRAYVWKIDRVKFRQIMLISGSREKEENLNFLKSVPLLNDLSEDILNKIVDLLQKKFYETNTCIVREGDIGNEFFIIRGGTVTIKKKLEQVERIVDRRKRGDYFGEQALLNADYRQASVFADAPGTEVLKLDREAFNSYLGTIPQLREKPTSKYGDGGRESNRKSEFDNEYAHVHITELKKIATLGAGAFGRVDLVAYGKKTFALKIIKKIDIVKQDQIDHVYSEKHVMMKCRSCPFIIELFKTFRNDKYVYFLMEPCMGGDVWTVMSQRGYFDEKTARFIAGCVVEAFDFLHSHNIIYRDLKPENLMLTTDGYCKLVDFGFAKLIPHNQKTNTFAGTPEYVAPEIILDRGHDRSVDYWALGILIFELLVGRTPFRDPNQIKIYQQILGGIDVIQMPSKIPKSAQGLIKHLCKQLPAERLGYQRRGILDIKRHSWFDSLDWNKLRTKQLISPIKRPINGNTDVKYFGSAGVDNEHDPPDETSGWDIDF